MAQPTNVEGEVVCGDSLDIIIIIGRLGDRCSYGGRGSGSGGRQCNRGPELA